MGAGTSRCFDFVLVFNSHLSRSSYFMPNCSTASPGTVMQWHLSLSTTES